MNSSTYCGLRWLMDSGLQERSGGVHRAYSSAERSFEPVTAEATAWYVLALLSVGKPAGEQRVRAERAGRYLLERCFDPTTDLAVAAERDSNSPEAKSAEIVSSGIVLRALVALWRLTGEAEYFDRAQRCGRAIQNRMSRVDGSYFARYDVEWQTPLMDVEAGVEQLKLAAAFLDLAEDGAHEFEHPARLLTKWALSRCESVDPSMADAADLAQVMNAYGLYLEGLLPSAVADMRAGQALQSGLLRLEAAVRRANGSSTPDALGRLLRLRLYADALGMMELDYGRARAEAEELGERQMMSLDPRLDGAFTVEPHDAERPRRLRPEATAVAAQALAMWDKVEDGGFRGSWRELI